MTEDTRTVYCPHCGAEMHEAEVAGRVRQVCAGCGFVLYRNPVPGVGVLVEQGSGLVLIKRGENPFKGWWALPAGYIEADESAEQAAVRECREETGLEVELLDLFGVGSFPEGPIQSGIIIFYRARPVGGKMRAGDDAQDVGVFEPQDIPEQLAFRTHREVVERWVRSQLSQEEQSTSGAAIRDFRHEDMQAVMALLRLISTSVAASAEKEQAASQRLRENPALDVLVADLGDQVVGFLALTFVPGLSGPRALIGEMAVDPAYQRQGIGAALVEAAIQRASRRGATHLLVDTTRGDAAAQEFYQACGFETGGVAHLYIR